MKKIKCLLIISAIGLSFSFNQAQAFCGFYVSKADTKLFNKASKVVIARHDDKTVITMANDYEGDLKEFAIVIPVPTFLEEEQIHVTESALIDHLDAYTAPRLVEYFDGDPCLQVEYAPMTMNGPTASFREENIDKKADALGVTIEAEYTVGEYDILILSAKESDGLAIWLKENNYKIPQGAEKVLDSYIKQGTRFFVAKVNLEEQAKLGATYLRPIQVAFESEKFMLPIRLGTVNAKDTQELFIFTLTQKGRVETTNYRTVKIPSNMNIPLYVKENFSDFYISMFDQAVKKEDMRAVFLEYAWNMNWCDPCAADPLSNEQLRELGVFWLDKNENNQAKNVFVTRLHVRYDGERFPEDLRFHETADRSNFQGRYILNHPWQGKATCSAGEDYFKSLPKRFDEEAKTLAKLTGWNITAIRDEMKNNKQSFEIEDVESEQNWWQQLWN